MARRTARFLAALPATVYEPGGSEFSCEALNLNRESVLLRGNLPRPEGREIRFAIRSVAGDLELPLTGHVARVAKEEDGCLAIGVRFDEVPEARRPTLEALIARVVEGQAPAALETLTVASSPGEIRAALDKIPVPHRIALAMRAMAQERAWLRHDANPKVLEALARNPNTNIREIKELVRMPDHLPTTLAAIADDVRWKRDDELKVMVATHPRVTLRVAEKLVASMDAKTRQKTLQTPGLHPALRAKLLATRGPR